MTLNVSARGEEDLARWGLTRRREETVLDDDVREGDNGPEDVDDEGEIFLWSVWRSSSDVGLSRDEVTIRPGADGGGLRIGGTNVDTENVDPTSDEATDESAVFGRRRNEGNRDA